MSLINIKCNILTPRAELLALLSNYGASVSVLGTEAAFEKAAAALGAMQRVRVEVDEGDGIWRPATDHGTQDKGWIETPGA